MDNEHELTGHAKETPDIVNTRDIIVKLEQLRFSNPDPMVYTGLGAEGRQTLQVIVSHEHPGEGSRNGLVTTITELDKPVGQQVIYVRRYEDGKGWVGGSVTMSGSANYHPITVQAEYSVSKSSTNNQHDIAISAIRATQQDRKETKPADPLHKAFILGMTKTLLNRIPVTRPGGPAVPH